MHLPMILTESRRGKWRVRLIILFFFTSILFFFLFSSATSCKEFGWLDVWRSSFRVAYVQAATMARRRLLRAGGVLGSYPPRCMAKCGTCNPCFPVHVPVPPGTPVITEYYPEAWRCKCGNRLFMP